MKKNLLKVVSVLFLCIILTGCGKDKIIGTWKHNNMSDKYIFENEKEGYYEIAGEKLDFKYKKDKKKITIKYSSPRYEATYDYDISEGVLTLTDKYGNKEKYKKQ